MVNEESYHDQNKYDRTSTTSFFRRSTLRSYASDTFPSGDVSLRKTQRWSHWNSLLIEIYKEKKDFQKPLTLKVYHFINQTKKTIC